MNKIYILLLSIVLLISSSNLFSQDNYCNKQHADEYLSKKGEVYFSFTVFNKADINNISRIVSIDNVRDFEVFTYANRNEFDEFLKLNIPYYILKHPGDADFDVKMSDSPLGIMEWDTYPTYDAYVTMMNQFAATYPNLCQIINIGPTVQMRSLLIAKIKNNVSTADARPKFMYTSSMHGDEVTGYVLMLRLINYLLTNYGTDPKVTNLVNNVEIWINPLANPDGTYHGGNNTVNGATRNNANGYDLNRNYPGVDFPNSAAIQTETQNFMNFATANNLTLSSNFHGGAEVVNYPWDSWARLCTDDAWWIRASRQYADTVHAHAVSGYMTDLVNGITNGYAWYYVHGSRQDYQCYYRHSREVTIEISSTKLLPPGNLPAHWEYNYRSFLNFMEKVLYGVSGTVTDSVTNLPLRSKVFINSFDTDSSEIYSEAQFGKYYRMIIQGTYNITFSAPGYYSKTISGVYVKNDSLTTLNVKLRPNTTGIISTGEVAQSFELYQNYPNPFNPSTKIRFSLPNPSEGGAMQTKLVIYDLLGREISVLVDEQLKPGTYEVDFGGSNYSSGIYFYRIETDSYTQTNKMLLIK